MNNSKATAYFEKTGKEDVFSWWNPEDDDRSHLYQWEMQIASDWINSSGIDINNAKFLELACGKGRIRSWLGTNHLSSLPDDCDYTVVDINPKMLEFAKSRYKEEGLKVKTILGNIQNLSLPSDSFDVIICLDSFVHFSDLNKVLDQVCRVLKPGGILISNIDLSTSTRRKIKSFFYRLNSFFNKKYYYRGQNIFKPYSSQDFMDIQSRHSLKNTKQMYYGLFAPIDIEIWDKNHRPYLLSSFLSKALLRLDKFMSKYELFSSFNTYLITLSEKK